MKVQLIMLPQPILVSDEKRRVELNKFYYEPDNMQPVYSFTRETLPDEYYLQEVLAGIPQLPSIDFSVLSDDECKRIGWVDVEKLAEKIIQDEKVAHELKHFSKRLIVSVFKAAQSLSDKKYSLQDMIDWLHYYQRTAELGFYSTAENHGKPHDKVLRKFIDEELNKPKVFNVEVEMEDAVNMDYKPSFGNGSDSTYNPMYIKVPKVTNNSIKILKLL